MLVAGCGSLGTGDDRRRAEELAEDLFPGTLKVIDARNLFPEAEGSEITFAFTDDPDAAARLRIDADRDRCDRGATCADALRGAVGRARADADRIRTMRKAFEDCGFPVLAVDERRATPWVEAEVGAETVEDVLASVQACARHWVRVRAARNDVGAGSARPLTSVSVSLAAPATAARLPSAEADLPTALRLAHGPRLAALSKKPYYEATYRVTGADGGDVDLTSPSLRRVLPFEERQAFGREASASALPVLRRTYPRAVPVEAVGLGVWRLEPGRIDRSRGYVLFCERPPADGRTCLGDHAAVVLADARGHAVSVLRVLDDIRDDGGVLRLPPL